MVWPTVLSPEGLQHIVDHKYVAGKYTALDNFLNPFWLNLAESLPNWLAPNLVTLTGFLPTVICYALAWCVSPSFEDPAPRLLSFSTAFAVFIYQTLDAVDGKQARRTKSSSPLGQLFDHGCDGLACVSHHSVACMVIMPGTSKWNIAGLSTLQSAFWMANWQEYHTGVLQTACGPVGVTETQFALMFMAIFSGLLGPEMNSALASSSVQLPWADKPETIGIITVQVWVAFTSTLMVISFVRTTSHAVKTAGVSGGLLALWHLTPIAILNLVLFYGWDAAVYALHARSICCLTGLVLFYYTAQMILFSMAKMPFPALQLGTLPAYSALAFASKFVPASQLSVLIKVSPVLVAAWVFWWLSRVIDELKTGLGIYAFSLQKKESQKKAE